MTDSAPAPPLRSTLAGTWALFAGIMLIMAGNGLQFTTVGVRSTLEDFTSVAIGVMTASYYLGFLIGARFTFGALGRVGHIRVFAALASSASASVLLHTLWVNPASWTLMRFTTGFCMAGLFIVSESWINDRATNATRGLLMSAYMVVGIGGRAAGQGLLNVGDPTSFDLFVISSLLVSVALVPMAMSATSAPPVVVPQPMSFTEMRKVVPSGLITVFTSGLTTATLGGLTAVYATRVGMSTAEVSLLITSLLIGAVVLQIPIGTASDRILRRVVMLATTVVASGAAVALAIGPETGLIPMLLIFVLGGTAYPLYSLGVAYTNDWIPDEKRASASVVLMITSGCGAIAGPIVASVAMARSVAGLFWMVAMVHALYGVYLFVRIVIRRPVPADQKSRFTPVPERATAMIFSRSRRRSGNGDSDDSGEL